jgi:pSer/pThr/pTyr-binding forkhead associated (FHA) protein
LSDEKRKYVPHNIKLKMQWDKFSTDSAKAMGKLENEFLIAAIDHINDRHYFTYAPLSIEVKPDYFITGVKLYMSFEKLEGDGNDAELDVTLDNLKASDLMPDAEMVVKKRSGELSVAFVANGKPINREFVIEEGGRLSVGRTKGNDIAIDDQSISKAHASILLNKEGSLIVADTGSTNGTFVRGERIVYGKAIPIASGDSLMFGIVKVVMNFERLDVKAEPAPTEAFKVGEFQFSSRKAEESSRPPQPTVAAVPVKPETVTPVAKPEPAQQSSTHESKVAPQPALSEAKVKIPEERQEWEV